MEQAKGLEQTPCPEHSWRGPRGIPRAMWMQTCGPGEGLVRVTASPGGQSGAGLRAKQCRYSDALGSCALRPSRGPHAGCVSGHPPIMEAHRPGSHMLRRRCLGAIPKLAGLCLGAAAYKRKGVERIFLLFCCPVAGFNPPTTTCTDPDGSRRP